MFSAHHRRYQGEEKVAQRGLWPQPNQREALALSLGRGWLAAGAFSGRRESGEGVAKKVWLEKQDFTTLQCRLSEIRESAPTGRNHVRLAGRQTVPPVGGQC